MKKEYALNPVFDPCYKELAVAICKYATEDYKFSMDWIARESEKIQECFQVEEKGETLTVEQNRIVARYFESKKLMDDVEEFFMGGWGHMVSGIPGESMMQAIRKEADDFVSGKSKRRRLKKEDRF